MVVVVEDADVGDETVEMRGGGDRAAVGVVGPVCFGAGVGVGGTGALNEARRIETTPG